MSTHPAGSTKNSGRVFSIIGAVLAVIALIFLPIILGPIGAVLGFVGYSKGDKPLGLWVGIGAIVATILGMVLGAVVYNANT
jgi:hypothetical protein